MSLFLDIDMDVLGFVVIIKHVFWFLVFLKFMFIGLDVVRGLRLFFECWITSIFYQM